MSPQEKSSTSNTPELKGNLRSEAYDAFMSCLFRRELRLGRLMSQREIAEVTRCSLASIREALKRLEGEGIVELIPKRGVYLREVKKKEIADAYEIRLMIETKAVRVYAQNCDFQEVSRFRVATEAILARTPQSQEEIAEIYNSRVKLDQQLHHTIVSALDNDVITQIAQKIETTMLLARLTLPIQFFNEGPAFSEHLTLIDELEKHNVEGAVDALTEHLTRSCDRALRSAEF